MKSICIFCLKKTPIAKLTFDHILPKSSGGPNSYLNAVFCCKPCNARKANLSLEKFITNVFHRKLIDLIVNSRPTKLSFLKVKKNTLRDDVIWRDSLIVSKVSSFLLNEEYIKKVVVDANKTLVEKIYAAANK